MSAFNEIFGHILIVSHHFAPNAIANNWINTFKSYLVEKQQFSVICADSLENAQEILFSDASFSVVILDIELALSAKSLKLLMNHIKTQNHSIPAVLIYQHGLSSTLSSATLMQFDSVICLAEHDSLPSISNDIKQLAQNYIQSLLPPFFKEIVNYARQGKTSWHTPGHMGGQGFLWSPVGRAFHQFYGKNVLQTDLSVSVPELGALVDHSGAIGVAEKKSAEVFDAHATYYVLTGTTAANQIVWKSVVLPNEQVLVDRNCHKALNYALIVTDAKPHYIIPQRNQLGLIGAANIQAISDKLYKIVSLTNSTYDGICYNMPTVVRHFQTVKNLHFDEAWLAHAKFHPLYRDHYSMSLPVSDKCIFATQSTHKLLAAFSQSSMLHIKFSQEILNTEARQQHYHELFNEAYKMYTSTSPQYSMIASLDVATQMMQDSGLYIWKNTIKNAIELRKAITSIYNEKQQNNDWFFKMWQPDCVAQVSTEALISDQAYWQLKQGDSWHGFNEIEHEATMLDPVKLTFISPGRRLTGTYLQQGIPAAVVTKYLRKNAIVCEKSDYYSWLLLHSLGITQDKHQALIAQLLAFKQHYDDNVLLKYIFPKLVSQYPQRYHNVGLQEHCQEMHEFIKNKQLLELIDKSFTQIPNQCMTPSQAYQAIVRGQVEFIELDAIDVATQRISAKTIVPYPPGIPMIMGGEAFDTAASNIINYLKARALFENTFPGYEEKITGIKTIIEPNTCLKKFYLYLISNA